MTLTLAKPPAVGIAFHRNLLASMTSADLFQCASGNGRHANVVAWRRAACCILRVNTSLSFPDIAVVMGRPCHSTFVTAWRDARPVHHWGEAAQALRSLHHEAVVAREWTRPGIVEDWWWVEAWNGMKKEQM